MIHSPQLYEKTCVNTWHTYTVTPHSFSLECFITLNGLGVDLCVFRFRHVPVCIKMCAEGVSLTYLDDHFSMKTLLQKLFSNQARSMWYS